MSTFEIIDRKQFCKNIVSNGSILSEYDIDSLSSTWEYHPLLKHKNINYAKIFVNGKTLNDCCPEYLRENWEEVQRKNKVFARAFRNTKVRMTNCCLFDLLPENFTVEYFSLVNKITDHVLKLNERPKNYDFLVRVFEVCGEIENQKLNIDFSPLKRELYKNDVRAFYEKIKKTSPYIKYNVFGSKTGRLSTKPGSFPMLNFNKQFRNILKPQNDLFVEIDYNAAELRTLLALNNYPQPEEDIHDWHIELFRKYFGETLNRDQAKQKVFAWLYNEKADTPVQEIKNAYSKSDILAKYYKNGSVSTPFGRTIPVEAEKALNFIIQSSSNDNFLLGAIKAFDFLQGKKSFVTSLMHDSILIDLKKEEEDLVADLVEIMQNTALSKFKVNIKKGYNFGEMR